MVNESKSLNVIGQPLPRLEDKRHLDGYSRFVADVPHEDCKEVAFLRSSVAFGSLNGLQIPEGINSDAIWDAEKIDAYTHPITARLLRPNFNVSDWPLLARQRVRFVGEAIAAVVADTRAEAEDIAASVQVNIDDYPPVVNVLDELDKPSKALHENLESNVVMRTARTLGDEAVFNDTKLKKVRKQFSMARVQASPLETRGCYCYIDKGTGELVVYASHQRPHLFRTFLARQLKGISEADIRVIIPDVGGGFGGKSNFYPEEVVVAALTLATGQAHRWIEDRYEHMVASNHARQHEHDITAYFDETGRIHAIDAKFMVDSGAYSAMTSTGAIEANMAASVMLGPYDIRNYRFEALSVFTNKSPVGPFRGVGRPAACFAMERIVDEVAHTLNKDPLEIRRINLIQQHQFPYTTATDLYYDSGQYEQAISHAEKSGQELEQKYTENSARYRYGTGYAMYVEQAGHGSVEWHRRGSPMVYGHETARVSVNLDGSLAVYVGTLSHGQGHFTSLAQIASEETGIPVEQIRIRQGDTSASSYGMGSVASRSIVMAGGAVAVTCRALMKKINAIAAAILECPIDELNHQGTEISHVSGKSTTISEVAHVALTEIYRLPKEIPPGLTAEESYRPEVETGTFSYGVHIARVRVDTYTGITSVMGYTVVEDCGTVVNPLIVDGQVRGGVAQGIGQALFEELKYNKEGQPEAVTFADYRIPSAVEVPNIDIVHMSTPSPFSEFGVKGMGEGGVVGPPAAIANATRNALKEWNIPVDETPIRSFDTLEKIRLAKGKNKE